MRTGGIISERKETPSTPKTLLKIGYSITLKYLYNMSLFETFGRIFSPTGELPEMQETLIECPNCGTFSEHDFCCDDCESEWADKKKDNDGDYDSERDKELENN